MWLTFELRETHEQVPYTLCVSFGCIWVTPYCTYTPYMKKPTTPSDFGAQAASDSFGDMHENWYFTLLELTSTCAYVLHYSLLKVASDGLIQKRYSVFVFKINHKIYAAWHRYMQVQIVRGLFWFSFDLKCRVKVFLPSYFLSVSICEWFAQNWFHLCGGRQPPKYKHATNTYLYFRYLYLVYLTCEVSFARQIWQGFQTLLKAWKRSLSSPHMCTWKGEGLQRAPESVTLWEMLLLQYYSN